MPITARKPATGRLKALARSEPSRKAREMRKAMRRSISLGGLNAHLGYFVRRAQVSVFQDFNRTLKDLDISPAQYSVLWVIDANTGLSQTELARTLGIQRARLVRMLHRLDRRGLTKRMQSSADGRTHALRLTSKGQEMLQRATALAEQHEARLVTQYGPEDYRILKSILSKF